MGYKNTQKNLTKYTTTNNSLINTFVDCDALSLKSLVPLLSNYALFYKYWLI